MQKILWSNFPLFATYSWVMIASNMTQGRDAYMNTSA